MMSGLSHLDIRGQAAMVDVGGKAETRRYARAWGMIRMDPATLQLVTSQKLAKGDVFAAARLAGVMAAKRTGDLIPLCHPLPLTWVSLELFPLVSQSAVVIIAEASLVGRTGIEMEALMAVTVAGLTLYDMCKAVDKSMILEQVSLLEKKGGRSGHYWAPQACRLRVGIVTELEIGDRVEWKMGDGQTVSFHHRQAAGLLLAESDAKGLAMIQSIRDEEDKVVVMGGVLLQTLPCRSPSSQGGFAVVKPGMIENEALLAVLG